MRLDRPAPVDLMRLARERQVRGVGTFLRLKTATGQAGIQGLHEM